MANLLQQQINQLNARLQRYESAKKKAAVSALNRMVQKSKTHTVRAVSKQLKIPSKILKGQVSTRRANANSVSAAVKSFLRPISAARLLTPTALQNYKGTGNNRRGVKVAGQQFNSAFINAGKASGRFHVLKRVGLERYPLERITIKIDSQFNEKQTPIVQEIMRNDFPAELRRQLNFRMNR